jgi:hypothetical protein
MTQEELKAKIQELKDAAENLDEPDKTFKLIDVRNLDSQLAGMALEELRQKLEQIRLIDLREIDQQIATGVGRRMNRCKSFENEVWCHEGTARCGYAGHGTPECG